MRKSSRHFWVALHRYAGLYMAVFLIIAGVTGSILPFGADIFNGLVLPTVLEQAKPTLTPVELALRAQTLAPHAYVSRVMLAAPDRDRAFPVVLEPRMDDATGKPFDLDANALLLDPYSGEEVARVTIGEDLWPITRINFIPLVVALHYRLAIPGSLGVWLFGISALVWTLDCFVAAYLTFPAARRRHPESPASATGSRTWLGRWWNPAWLVRWQSSAYRLNMDLHRAGGLWLWVMLWVFAWSSVGLNLRSEVYDPVMHTVFGSSPRPTFDPPKLPAPVFDPDLGWPQAVRIGEELMADQAREHGFEVREGFVLYYHAELGIFDYWVTTDHRASKSRVRFDGRSGRLVAADPVTALTTGEQVNDWLMMLHFGGVWGLPYRIFVSVMGLAVAVLSVTGIVIWLKKRSARRAGAASRLQRS